MVKKLHLLLFVIICISTFVPKAQSKTLSQKIQSYWYYEHPLIQECQLYIGLPLATIRLHPRIENLYYEKIEEQIKVLHYLRNSDNYHHLENLSLYARRLQGVKNQLINLKSQMGWVENDSKNIYSHAESIIQDMKKELQILGVYNR